MALVSKLEKIDLEKTSTHDAVQATYSIIRDEKNGVFLQIDTYGSKRRKMLGKKSQSLRFSGDGIESLRKVLAEL